MLPVVVRYPSIPQLITANPSFPGRLTLVGLGASAINFPLTPIALRELDIVTCFWGNKSELVEILDAIAAGHISPVVHTAPLSEVVEKFHDLEQGKVQGRIAFVS